MLHSNSHEPICVVDIGNTNIVCAVYQNESILWQGRFDSDVESTPEEYFQQLSSAMPHGLIALVNHVALGSVVPALTSVLEQAFTMHTKARIHHINGLSALGIGYKTKQPASVGADLVANAFAAWKKHTCDCLVIDMGTATTIQLILEDGTYAGVVIAPGMKTAASHLFQKAAQLYDIALYYPEEILGNDTNSALMSGIVLGHVKMMEGLVTAIQKEYLKSKECPVIVTGGLSALVKSGLPGGWSVDSDLTLDGFYMAALHLLEQSAV